MDELFSGRSGKIRNRRARPSAAVLEKITAAASATVEETIDYNDYNSTALVSSLSVLLELV